MHFDIVIVWTANLYAPLSNPKAVALLQHGAGMLIPFPPDYEFV